MTRNQSLQADGPPPDHALLDLGERLLDYWRLQNEVLARTKDDTSKEADREAERAIDLVSGIVEKIARTPATTLEGFRVKALALRWCHNAAEIAEDTLMEEPCTDMRLAALIARDILEATGGQGNVP
ncbi:hypothetical protein [Oceanibaculum sp.]|uniref:hypothetical protein n=1 Tax=Oceanibaculum sp. TaxID=1903597 RepID=UPI00258FC2C0|nr:hypothetical protein [Oceanibaculum sp.]MCH2393211.1 hypothetical protein [Oceanibaculum sp.]